MPYLWLTILNTLRRFTMAFADPQTVTINAVPQSLVRVKSDGLKSEYKTADEVYKFVISHQESGKRVRHMVRIDKRVVAADPLTATNDYKSLGMYIVIDEPEYGFTDAEVNFVKTGLLAWASDANVLKVLAGEH